MKVKGIMEWINGWAGWGFVIVFMLFVLSIGYWLFTTRQGKMKLNKEEKEFIKSVEESDMPEDKKKRLINMVKVNRIFMDKILELFELPKIEER